MAELITVLSTLAALSAILVFPARWAMHSVRHVVRDEVVTALEPYLMNGEKTVARYAHDAADSAKEARDAAYEAKAASLETRDLVLTLKEGR
jgi:hypothetical protein